MHPLNPDAPTLWTSQETRIVSRMDDFEYWGAFRTSGVLAFASAGTYALRESVRRLRGISPPQLDDFEIPVAHGVGGMFGAGWLAFIRPLKARGLSGVKLVVSDGREGLKPAIAAELPGAAWQRCRAHFFRNLLTKVPKASADMIATLVRSIFVQPDWASAYAQFDRVDTVR